MRLGDSAGRTDPGRVRRRNEDSFVIDPPLFAVADGMGGAQAGEVASRLAAAAFREYHEADSEGPEARVRAIIQEANRRIYERARSDSEASGMGTTITAALVGADGVTIGHVGDSRAYRIREGRLEQLTDDHSLVADLMRGGRLTQEEAEAHPQRSVITRALGTDPDVDVDTLSVEAAAGDLFLLCSDGLTTMVPDEAILRTVEEASTLDDAALALLRAANKGGGEDNITVVLFRLEAGADAEETLVAPGARTDEEAVEDEDTLTDLSPVATAVATAPAPAGAEPEAEPEQIPEPAWRPRPRRTGPRWGRRILWALLAVGFVALVLGGALYGLSRAYFVGAGEDGYVTVYQGIPYDLRDGVGLYRERYVSPVQASQLSADERAELFGHQLLSYERARASVELYEAEALP
ncbi:MAG TPA: Stp1/IreP family PP2C-type Ser/Thr phosphatase [Gaiellaceae bacterium]|nr:Stp1/IreP family PP2C-type Ser/Thr phosphatase [Gaiellaceae bacterium]